MKINLSTWSKLQIFISATGIIFTAIGFILNASPTFAGKVDVKVFPFLNPIPWYQWVLIFIAMWVIIVLIWFGAEKQKIKSEVIDFLPQIKLADQSPNVDRVDRHFAFYEKDSYLTKHLTPGQKRELIYFDVVNIPTKKDKEKGTAKDVSYWIEVHNYDQEILNHRKYRAKWVPETKESIDIIPDRFARRVGLGFIDSLGILVLLDSNAHYDENGLGSQSESLYYGKFVFVAHISTSNNIYDDSPLFFLVENIRNESPKITEMKDGDIWVKKVKQASNDLWKDVIEKNKNP